MPSMLETLETGADGSMTRARMHSFSGYERNSFFLNSAGKSFEDLSSVSGLDHIADGRAMALLDFNRDGWRDVLIVNSNSPQTVLLQNDFGKVLKKPARVIAVRLHGGATSSPSNAWSNRDGYGAVVTIETEAGKKQSRELRCGEGFAAQNSSTILFGLGDAEMLKEVTVQWPSGKKQTLQKVPHNSEITFFERPSELSGGKSTVIRSYIAK